MRGGTAAMSPSIVSHLFQSTRPVRGGTRTLPASLRAMLNFNPPAPCGAGLLPAGFHPNQHYFNPPAPCGAGPGHHVFCASGDVFQSTRPVRGGTPSSEIVRSATGISIHPPRAGRDAGLQLLHSIFNDFNPPAPCGAGLIHTMGSFSSISNFNPPAPCGAGHQRQGDHRGG